MIAFVCVLICSTLELLGNYHSMEFGMVWGKRFDDAADAFTIHRSIATDWPTFNMWRISCHLKRSTCMSRSACSNRRSWRNEINRLCVSSHSTRRTQPRLSQNVIRPASFNCG